MNLRGLVVFSFIFLCLISTASARETYEKDDVTYIDYEVPDGYLISTVHLDNLEPNFNTTTILDAFGKEYVLYVNNTKNIGWWTYYITLQYPNGSTTTTTVDTFQPFATDTDIKIQHYYSELDSIFDVDVYVAVLPLTASFELLSLTNTYDIVAFSDVQASSDTEFDFSATYVTAEEFQGQVEESILELLAGSTDLFFDWAWDSILAFVEMIPGVGPYLSDTLEISALIIDDIFFYFNLLFVEYLETTILTIEFFILSASVIKTKKDDNIFVIIDTILSTHKTVIEFVFKFAVGAISIFTEFIKMIAAIVSSIKPL